MEAIQIYNYQFGSSEIPFGLFRLQNNMIYYRKNSLVFLVGRHDEFTRRNTYFQEFRMKFFDHTDFYYIDTRFFPCNTNSRMINILESRIRLFCRMAGIYV